jgi:WD40 repeat protein
MGLRTIMVAASLVTAPVVPLASLRSQERSDPVESEIAHIWRVDGPSIEVVRTARTFSYTFLNNIDAFSPDGRRVVILPNASGSDRMEIRSAADGALVQDVHYPRDVGLAYTIAFSPTGTIALGRYGSVSLYDGDAPDSALATFETDPISGGSPCRPTVCRAVVESVAFSPDGTLVAFQEANSQSPLRQDYEGSVYVAEATTGRRVAKLEAFTGRPNHVAFSPDGRRLVAIHRSTVDGRLGPFTFRVWDTATWELMKEVNDLGRGFEPLAIGAAAGISFAAVYAVAGGRLELRDLDSDRVLWSVPLYSPPFERKPDMAGGRELTLDHVAIAPNGKFVVGYEGPGWMIRRGPLDEPDSLGYFGAIVVRDTLDGSIVATYDIRNVKALAISPDSRTLLYSVGFHQTYVALARLP